MTIPHSGASEKERLQAELATAPAEQGELATMDPAVKFSGLRFLIIEDQSLIALDLKDRLGKPGPPWRSRSARNKKRCRP